MDSHMNARLTARSRELLARKVVEQGVTTAATWVRNGWRLSGSVRSWRRSLWSVTFWEKPRHTLRRYGSKVCQGREE